MTWDYRVIATEYEGELMFGIHEVYSEDGVPTMCTENAMDVAGETLDWMRAALLKPILSYADFEEGGKYYMEEDDE